MKNILIGLFVLLSISASAQVKRDKYLEKVAGNLKITYQKITDMDNDKITYSVYLSFQNDKYKSLTDIKVIGLYSAADIEAITKDMKNVFKQMFSGEKTNMDWTREKYKMTLYDFTTNMYFAEAKGTGGYTIMPKRAVSDFIEIISTIDFGKETLLPAKSIEELIP
jgi:hypothetical protein